MQQRQMWIATAAVIVSVIGGSWAVGRNMATRDDVAELRAELQASRESTAAQFVELRAEVRAAHESADAQFVELRTEIRASMEELRGYIVPRTRGDGPGQHRD